MSESFFFSNAPSYLFDVRPQQWQAGSLFFLRVQILVETHGEHGFQEVEEGSLAFVRAPSNTQHGGLIILNTVVEHLYLSKTTRM